MGVTPNSRNEANCLKQSLRSIATSIVGKFSTKHLCLIFLIFMSVFTAHAELWTPIGEVDWTEGALTGQSSTYNKTWKVAVERSDTRPGVFRLQPYANHPLEKRQDNVYVYLHTEDPKKVYMEYYIYRYYYSSYFHVFQRCPENGFDTQYYGTIKDANTIEFPVNSFAVDNLDSTTKQNAPTSQAKYSTRIHKIVFPDGVLGYTPPQESWVSIGTGHFVDPFFTSSTTGEPWESDFTVYKSTMRQDVYKFTKNTPTDRSDIYLHTQNPDKVYLESYSAMNTAGTVITITQQCPENGTTLSQYGQLKEGVVEIPSEYFVYSTQETSNTVSEGRKCIITLPEGYNKPIEEENGIYMGIVSFNDQLQNKPISQLDENSKDEFINFIDNMQMGNATLLYYAVDQAITTMTSGVYPDNLSNAILITFTDGLDQGSLAMKPEHRNSRTYAAYLSERIGNTTVQENPLQAYAIGLKSTDVVDDELFMLNLTSLASSPENAHYAGDLKEVQDELNHLYEELNRQISKRVVTIAVPMMSHEDTYRFTLDHTTENADNSQLWFEGVFNIDDFSLENIVYHGLTSKTGDKIIAERDGLYLKFTLDDCRDLDGNILEVEKEDIDQWTYIASRNAWQHNIENDKDGKINIEDIKNSAIIMFAIDCSSSLGNLFPTVKEIAGSFIERLAGGNTSVHIKEIRSSYHNDNATIKYYNLQGIEVSQPRNGLFIEVKDGKSRKVYLR